MRGSFGCAFLLLVAFCFLLNGCSAITILSSQCEAWEEAPRHCDAILNPFNNGSKQVWVSRAYGLTQEYFNARLWSYLDLAYGLPQPCVTLYLRLMCPTLFQPCTPHPVNPALTIPHPPCYSVCRDFLDTCGAGLSNEILALFDDCNTISELTGTPQWPNNTQGVAACSPMPLDEIGEVEFTCPRGLHFYPPGDPKVTQPGLVCAMTCKDFITVPTGYRQGRTEDAWIEQSCLAAISFVLILFLFVTMLVFPPTRQWPRRISIFVCIGVIFVYTALVGDIFYGSSTDLFCDDDAKFDFTASTWCKYSSWAIYFGALVVLFWYSTQALVLFWNVALLKSPLLLAKVEPLFHVINWGYPMVASFIMLGLDEFGALPGYPYCFIASDAPKGLTWGLFFSIFALSALFVLIVIICVMIRLARESTLKETLWSRWKYQMQLFVFMVYFFFTTIYILALRSWYEAHEDELVAAVAGVYECLVKGGLPENCTNEQYLNLYLYFSNTFLIASLGLAVFIVFFVLNDFNRKLWPLAFRNWREGREIFYLPGTGGAGSSGGSGASSTSSSGDEAAQARRSNRTFRRKMAAERPDV